MIPTVNELVLQIVARMNAENVQRREPVSPETIAQFERQWNLELPPDMREFYRLMDGTSKDQAITDFLFCIWPLSEVKPIPTSLPEPVYSEFSNVTDAGRILCFSDCMIESDVFAIRAFGPHEVMSVYSGRNVVASSFTDFLSRMLADPISLM